MYEIAYVSYNFDGTWTDETFFRGTKAECEKWLEQHCAASYERKLNGGMELQYWLGNKRLDLYKA